LYNPKNDKKQSTFKTFLNTPKIPTIHNRVSKTPALFILEKKVPLLGISKQYSCNIHSIPTPKLINFQKSTDTRNKFSAIFPPSIRTFRVTTTTVGITIDYPKKKYTQFGTLQNSFDKFSTSVFLAIKMKNHTLCTKAQ
jgi:hypothetical protein